MATTHSTTTHNLMFLLAASPMGMACIIVADDTEDTTGADTGNVTTGMTTEADTAGTDTPVTGEGTGTGGSMDDSTSRGESSGADSTGGGSSEACAAYGANATMCMLPYSDYVETNCNYTLGYFGDYPDCAAAYVEFVTCLSALSCEELTSDAPCQAELDAFLALSCPAGE